MKAPNNADANLCEEDWTLVRTTCFKQKYGDWEKSYKKNFLLHYEAVKQLSGREFERVLGKSLTELVAEFFASLGGVARNKAMAYTAVKEVIEQGVLIDFDKNHKGERI